MGSTLLLPSQAKAPEIRLLRDRKIDEKIIVQGNSFQAQYPIPKRELKYEQILNCLIFYESKGKERAIGDRGTSFGILQYKKKTFSEYCINKYGLASSSSQIFNPTIQVRCADCMLREKWNNIYHWRNSARKCLK